MIDYNYYSTVYKGKLSEQEFTEFSRRATKLVEYYTFGRIKTINDIHLMSEVKLTICEIIDSYNDDDGVIRKPGVKSYTEGKQSVTFSDKDELLSYQKRIIRENLTNTGLLNRGWY